MHSDVHLQLHHLRATELHRQAAAYARDRRPRPAPAVPLRARLGWIMVEVGLRLAQQPPARRARVV
ncbi:hypothetical protein [Streptomyces hypolithicus]